MFCWGFTVDDAWIVSRVAHHGVRTGIYSFNPGGPVTDAVTPLGFAHVLGFVGGLLGLESPLELWSLARWIGLLCFFFSMGVAGYQLGKEGWRGVMWAGALSLLVVPSAVWAGAGLSTPIVGLLVILGATSFERGAMVVGGGLFGWACAWRPELAPFAVAWGGCRILSSEVAPTRKKVMGSFTAFSAFLVLSALVRWAAFGRLVPLAVIAKAPEAWTALFYAGVTMVWSGIGWLILARDHAFRRPGLWAVPWCVHLVAVFFAGGDWMPALRLTAPLFPLLVWNAGRQLRPSIRFWAAWVPALGFPLALLWTQGADLRAVDVRRRALVAEGREVFRDARVIASTDIGWVGVASAARIVDLAGVTDPRIAPLEGGHTSKYVSPGLFSARNVDTWVIRALDRSYVPGRPLELVVPAYWVDARLLRRSADLGFVGVATIPLAGTPGQYVIAQRREDVERVASR